MMKITALLLASCAASVSAGTVSQTIIDQYNLKCDGRKTVLLGGSTESPTASPQQTTPSNCPYTEGTIRTEKLIDTKGNDVDILGKGVKEGDVVGSYTAPFKYACGANVDDEDDIEGTGIQCRGFDALNTCTGSVDNAVLNVRDDMKPLPNSARLYCAVGDDTTKLACFEISSTKEDWSEITIKVGCTDEVREEDQCNDAALAAMSPPVEIVDVGLTVWDQKASSTGNVYYWDTASGDAGYTKDDQTLVTALKTTGNSVGRYGLSHISICVTEEECV